MGKVNIEIKKRFLSKKHVIKMHLDCACKAEAESIELAILQMLGQIKAFDFTDNGVQPTDGEEEETEEHECDDKIGFQVDLIGDDDGREPFDDEEEFEDE